eukprot:g7733.t1
MHVDNAADLGGGMFTDTYNNVTFYGSMILNNDANSGAGMFLNNSNNATLLRSIISSKTNLILNSEYYT